MIDCEVTKRGGLTDFLELGKRITLRANRWWLQQPTVREDIAVRMKGVAEGPDQGPYGRVGLSRPPRGGTAHRARICRPEGGGAVHVTSSIVD